MATGPAATTKARDPTGWNWKLSFFSASVMRRGGSLIGRARRILVAEKFHIAAEGNCGNLPAGAIAVVESGDLGAEANGEHQHLDAAPARHQKMTKLVKENDDGQNEQKRHDIADEAAAKGAQASHDFHSHYRLVLPHGAFVPPNVNLGCLYGNFGQEVTCQTSCNMVNGQRRVNSGRFRQ